MGCVVRVCAPAQRAHILKAEGLVSLEFLLEYNGLCDEVTRKLKQGQHRAPLGVWGGVRDVK